MASVLICEDDGLLGADLALSVVEAGHVVHGIYRTASEVLEDPNSRSADIAIVDLNLADGDSGALVAQALQKAGVRVIIVSGHSNASAALGAVPHTYAEKPVSAALVQELLAVGRFAEAS
jgi:ActR/RegA family two-component response regulator